MPKSRRELKHPHITVENDTAEPVTVLVSAIQEVAAGFAKINSSGLQRRAIVLMLHDMTTVGKKDIHLILDAAPMLAERYTIPSDDLSDVEP